MQQSGCIRPETTEKDRTEGISFMSQVNCITVTTWKQKDANTEKNEALFLGCVLTLFRVCVCPMRIRALEDMMDRQKLMRMTERSDRMYLQENNTKKSQSEAESPSCGMYASVHQSVQSHILLSTLNYTVQQQSPAAQHQLHQRAVVHFKPSLCTAALNCRVESQSALKRLMV